MTELPLVLAHQGGWDEALLVLVVVSLFIGLLWLANTRAGQATTPDPTDDDPV